MIDLVRLEVEKILRNDKTGHGIEHVNRVLNLSLKFAENENVNNDIVSLIALLHDVDDYKLFGKDNADNLTNARRIMNKCNIDKNIQEVVCDSLSKIGFRKRLKGIAPTLLEGMIVSDADMCDAIGANGILRVYAYTLSKGDNFFDREKLPIGNITADEYNINGSNSGINHFFDKILLLKDMMLTNEGKKEAIKRHQFVVSFLDQFFDEEEAIEYKKCLKKVIDKNV